MIHKLGASFDSKETVIELNGVHIEAYMGDFGLFLLLRQYILHGRRSRLDLGTLSYTLSNEGDAFAAWFSSSV
ncbi:MAG: hypothetical protein WA941_20210 [Nitrososphaeraceae archaeon]